MFGEPRPPFRHVLTAIDGSSHAEFAFEAAVRLRSATTLVSPCWWWRRTS